MTILQSTENCNAREEKRGGEGTSDLPLKAHEKASSNNTSTDEENKEGCNAATSTEPSFVRADLKNEIAKQVVRKKLAKLRHLVLKEAISPDYLDSLFPSLLQHFNPQSVVYNGGIANIKNWKISCYLEVMEGGVPTAEPNTDLLDLFHPLLDACDDLFLYWFRQKSACNTKFSSNTETTCSRLMTFITRYTPAPGEQALLKVGGVL